VLFNYEEKSKLSGIYELRNRISNISYIGSAVRFKERWSSHKNSLKSGKHQNKHLQYSFLKFLEQQGNDNFIEFHILEVMDNSTKAERLVQEEFWIDLYLGNGYKLYNNRLKPTKESQVWSHNPEETRKKLSELTNVGQFKHKTYKVNLVSPTGEIVRSITNFKKFCEDNGMSRRGLNCLLEKKCRSIKGWTLLEENLNKSIKHYNISLVSPVGEEFNSITNLANFCKEHGGLNETAMYSLVNNKINSYCGWRLKGHKTYDRPGQFLVTKNKIGNAIAKTHDIKLESPDGTIYGPIFNLSDFCRTHNLLRATLNKVIVGKSKHCQDWKLVRVDEIEEEVPTV